VRPDRLDWELRERQVHKVKRERRVPKVKQERQAHKALLEWRGPKDSRAKQVQQVSPVRLAQLEKQVHKEQLEQLE
jgi:hypothetical protein